MKRRKGARQLVHVPAESRWRANLHEWIFEADTRAGKAFDVVLLVLICLSVTAVCLESVQTVRLRYGTMLRAAEWAFTILFTIEYFLRMLAVRKPWRYVRSFYGIIDLLAIIPTYLSLFVGGAQSLLVIRALRLLRVFRILKLARFVREARMLKQALLASSRKIMIFLGVVLIIMLIAGSAMYLIEGERSGFTSIPRGIYWAVVTMTTVGYGDLTPHTVPGQFLASILMILGYGIIAVPTGIVSVSMAEALRNATHTLACQDCGRDGHANDATFCKFCGSRLE